MISMNGPSSNEPLMAEIRLAQEAFRAGNLPSAETRINRLIAQHPNRPEVLTAKGMMLMARGEQEMAVQSFATSLLIEPRQPETLGWAAFISLNLRRFPEAEGYARSLTEMSPQNPRGHYLLANALRGLDRIEEALQAIDRALELKPDEPDSLVTKARLLKASQMPGLAAEFYRHAMDIRPTPSAAIELARIHLRDSRPEAALQVLGLVEPLISPNDFPHGLVAEAYTLAGRFEEAEPRWALAIQRSGNSGAVAQGRAYAEIAAGRFEVGEELLRDLIERGGDIAPAFLMLTTTRKMKVDDLPFIERMEAVLERDDLGPLQQADLNYGLGKCFDDLRDFERAIKRFDEANRICREFYGPARAFDAEQTRAFNDFLIDTFTQEKVGELTRNGLESDLPLFVVGMMRSGTTLTENILSAHSKVKAGGEQAFWTERIFEFMVNDAGLLEYDHERARRLAGEYLRAVDPQEDVRYVVDKNPGNIELAPILHSAFPNAKIVHLKRHPVDNLLSLWMTPLSANVRYASDRTNLVFSYREYLRLWRHWDEVLPGDRFRTFGYEDLTSRPESTIASMLEFLGLDVEEACFTPEKNKRSVLTPSVFQVRQPINKGSQARWKNYEPWLGEFAELLDDAN